MALLARSLPMHRFWTTCWATWCGLWSLLRLAVITKFRFTGPYWTWRWQTALGPKGKDAVPARERFMAMLEYGRWVAQMRRL